MKFLISVVLLVSSCVARTLVATNDWSDLGDVNVMGGFEAAVGYVNTKETLGYRLPPPSIHSELIKEAVELSTVLEKKNSEN